jgi:putative chitinase
MNYSPDIHHDLERGFISKSVVILQEALNEHGFYLSVDGDFGPGTHRAVSEFQANSGLMPTGKVDRETWCALLSSREDEHCHESEDPEDELTSRIYESLISVQVSGSDASRWSPPLSKACSEYSINTVNRLSGFVANVVHESGHLKGVLVENLNYSYQSLMKNWPTRFDHAKANACGRTQMHPADQRMIANIAYGGRMGNAAFPSNDGWEFRGRGPFQLTGRDNYSAFSSDSGIDVVSDPELVLQPEVGSMTAGWYWSRARCSNYADRADWRGLRKSINGGVFGLEEVHSLIERISPTFS